MRWKYNPRVKPEPAIGDKRTKRLFVLIPRVIDNQWVWLEQILVEYTYLNQMVYMDFGGYNEPQWVKTKVSLIN